jgi:thiosulfate reductase cytochrome b subunit
VWKFVISGVVYFFYQLFSGRVRARLWHFLTMCGFLAFIPGHLTMVAMLGWNNFMAILTGWKRDPEYIEAENGSGD